MVGLVILYMGFAGVTGMTILGTTSGYILGMVYAVLGMGGGDPAGTVFHADAAHGGALHRAVG